MWKLNNMLWNSQGSKRKFLKSYLETNVNKSTTFQNVWVAAKAVLQGKFIAVHVYLMKQAESQINSLILHLTELEKEQTKVKVNSKKEIINIRAKTSKIDI